MKGETIGEITAAAKVMRAHCERFLNDMDVLEIVGTGGDGSNTFNISTLSALVTSAAGIPVAKHGNRAASSKCGTADCLEALGVKIDIAPALSAQLLKEINICFLFAQKYHTAMRFVGGVRKKWESGHFLTSSDLLQILPVQQCSFLVYTVKILLNLLHTF